MPQEDLRTRHQITRDLQRTIGWKTNGLVTVTRMSWPQPALVDGRSMPCTQGSHEDVRVHVPCLQVHMYNRASTYGGSYAGSRSGSYDGYKSGYTGGYSSSGSSRRSQGSSSSSGPGYSYPVDDLHDYYKILGVKRNASPAEVQEAFRTKALQQHPDRCVIFVYINVFRVGYIDW